MTLDEDWPADDPPRNDGPAWDDLTDEQRADIIAAQDQDYDWRWSA